MLALLVLSPTAPWRNYEEVFDLALDRGAILAATNGGLLRDGKPLPSPAGVRAIEGLRPLTILLADGRRLRQNGALWQPVQEAAPSRTPDQGDLVDGPWPLVSPPPPAHAYALLRMGDAILAGTAEGLWRFAHGVWARQALPSALPVTRPNGLAKVGETFVVGGLGGLFVGRPGAWRRGSEDAIRQIGTAGGAVWAIHGNGAVDKLELKTDRLYPDALSGSARRPWTSCLTANGMGAIFGGLGGWIERPGPERYPPLLKDDVVTAVATQKEVRWIGTQKTGLFRFEGAESQRWNPGNGLRDTWVTALLPSPTGLIVGTARGGLYRLAGKRIVPMSCPTQRVTALTLWKGRLVVGGMDGAWIAHGTRWDALPTGNEETTSLTLLDGRLVVTTAAGAFFLEPAYAGSSAATRSPLRARAIKSGNRSGVQAKHGISWPASHSAFRES